MRNSIRHITQLFISIAVLLVSFWIPEIFQAHELIPQVLQEYVEAHPDATPEEIKAFALEQSPEFALKYAEWGEILRIIREDDTSLIDNMFDFFKLWVWHILVGPDHILFVLSILLVFVSWREILRLTGVFTLAHSITLILAGTGLLVLSSRIVEPIIALSIAYIAFTSVFLRGKLFLWTNTSKIAAIFFFGLFHGLGFAGLLQEIRIPEDKFISSLLAFNLGIEWGQLIIVALAFPSIYFFKDRKWYPKMIQIFSAVIIVIALYWFVERLISL